MNRKQKVTVIFSFGALGLIIFLSALVLIRNKTFKGKTQFFTRIDTARGLSGYPPIYFKGYSIGQVNFFELSDDLSIRVNFFIFDEFKNLIYENAVLEKNQNILTGQITDFRLVLPHIQYRNNRKAEMSFIPESGSAAARDLMDRGIVKNTRDGVAGIVNKINELLDSLDRENTPEKISKLLKLTNGLLGETKRTIASYNAVQTPEAKDKVMLIIKKTNKGIDSVNKNLEYLKGILKVIHNNKDEIAPILLKTNRTLDDASDTLEGINNNPLIRGGIRKNNKEIRLETFD